MPDSVLAVGSSPVVSRLNPDLDAHLVDLSMRILVHLSYQVTATIDDIPRDGSTQLGMARDLGVTQGAVSKVLERLAAAGMVRYQRGHVVAQWRRQRVYQLTPSGQALARRIREHFRLPQLPPRAGWSWVPNTT